MSSPTAAPRRPELVPDRRALVALGTVLLLALGVLIGATAGAVKGVADPQEARRSGPLPVSTAAPALRTGVGTVGDVRGAVEEGDPRLVVMDADGSAAVFGHVVLRIELPRLSSPGPVAVVCSGALVAAAAGLVAPGLRRARRGRG